MWDSLPPHLAPSQTPMDIDLERRIITLNKHAKRSRPRQYEMSERQSSMRAP